MDVGNATAVADSPIAGVAEIVDECAASLVAHHELLGLRLGALFGILAVSAIGVALPYFTNFARLQNVIFLMKAFAGGVVIATGFVHILGDAVEGLASPCLGWPDFPWAMTLATFASLATFTFEWYLHKYFTSTLVLANSKRGVPLPRNASGNSTGCDAHIGVVVATPAAPPTYAAAKNLDEAEELEVIMYSVQSCTLEMGIIFHSIFIGISLGLNNDKPAVQSLMIALMFHQFNEGLAIGLTFIQARYSTLRYCILGATFLLTTPVGVAIGIIVGGSANYSATTLLGVEGVFNAIAAGILLYNGLVDLVVPTFSVHDPSRSSTVQALGFAALFTGAGIMCGIARWA